MNPRKTDDVVVFARDRFYCGPDPSVIVFPDGEILVFCRGHRSWTPSPLAMHFH